jgi:2',3'-cyclic-nucleotide 2'-phosphodiesterase (5'-nucleotidase family)
MRARTNSTIALWNGSGFRAQMTCTSGASSCPTVVTGPPWPITKGMVFGTLPFFDTMVAFTINGTELLAFLENNVAAEPNWFQGFLQLSGICYTYNASAAPGSRIVGARLQLDNGSCTGGAPVSFAASATYRMGSQAFTISGVSGFPEWEFDGRPLQFFTSPNLEVIEYLKQVHDVYPAPQGRVTCVGSACASVNIASDVDSTSSDPVNPWAL